MPTSDMKGNHSNRSECVRCEHLRFCCNVCHHTVQRVSSAIPYATLSLGNALRHDTQPASVFHATKTCLPYPSKYDNPPPAPHSSRAVVRTYHLHTRNCSTL